MTNDNRLVQFSSTLKEIESGLGSVSQSTRSPAVKELISQAKHNLGRGDHRNAHQKACEAMVMVKSEPYRKALIDCAFLIARLDK